VYWRAIEEFAKALHRRERAPIDAKAARQVLAVVLAIYQSATEQKVVSIS
jgi:predicted dehydrogenase